MTTDLEAEVEALETYITIFNEAKISKAEVLKLIKAHHKAERAAREELADLIGGEIIYQEMTLSMAKHSGAHHHIVARAQYTLDSLKSMFAKLGAADAQAKQERDEK